MESPRGPTRKPSFDQNGGFLLKKFSLLHEQLNILHRRKLKFEDYPRAKKYLLTNNYYNIINGYSKYFMNSSRSIYINGATFDEITHVHFFDKEIKFAFFKAIMQAEGHIKNILAYRFSEFYPDKRYAYLDINSYDNSKILEVGWIISNLSKIINDNSKRKNGNSIKHYVQKHGDVPIWVLIDYLDYGQMTTIFENLPTKLQNKIARNICSFATDNFSISSPFTPETMLSFVKNMREIRNVCAHNNKLLGFNCRGDVKYYDDLHSVYSIKQHDRRRDVYNLFIFIQCFISKTQYAQLHNTILSRVKNLDKKLDSISVNTILSALGFPNDWHKNTMKLPQN